MKVKYFFSFKEDDRKSMNILGNLILNGLKKFKNIKTSFFVPKIKFNFFLFSNLIQMRFERFISYPLQTINIKHVDIAHVIDHGYCHLFHFLNAKFKIITFNDLIPILFEKKFNKSNMLLKFSLSFISKYDHIISISQQSKYDLVKYKKINPQKISVVYPPVDETLFNLKKINKLKVFKKYNLPHNAKKVIVFDSIFYKNFEFSLKIFKKLLKLNENIILIKIGNFKDITNEASHNKIYQLKPNTRSDMSELYKSCDLLFFPSLYEGYGIPCIEAMKCGLPVVSSNRGSLKEIVHKKNFFKLNNEREIIQHIDKLLTNKKFFVLNKKISINQSKKFKEKDYYLNILKIYKRIINKNKNKLS